MKDTRQLILEKNFQSIHLHGFQGTRTDKVIADLGVSKGAFYHYFTDKLSLGYAVIDEIIGPRFIGLWSQLENFNGHPIDGIVKNLNFLSSVCKDEEVYLGCPLNNLMQEMSSLDEGFKVRLNKIISRMHYYISSALQTGKDQNQINKSVDPNQAAFFIIASIEGTYGLSKTLNSKPVFDFSMQQLIIFLEGLKVK